MAPLDREFTLYRLPEIEYQVKAIGYLHGFGRAATGSLGVDAVAVAAHHDHFRVLCQPRAQRVSRTRREQIDNFAAL